MINGLAARIKQERKNMHLSQKQLADRLRIHKSSVNAWESEKTQPSLIYLIKLSDIFSVTTDYLLGIKITKQLNVSNISDTDVGAIQTVIDSLKNKK
ncbi:MAG: helix-turn-helix domain-containing protein [Oscillospiraceae bacterium]|nr:helix-turn-helix domain-containing protein [Oscillospiraceae bacterium]